MSHAYFRKMGRHLNASCDFNTGYVVCDIPRDTIEVKLKIKTRMTRKGEQRSSIHGEKVHVTSRFQPQGR